MTRDEWLDDNGCLQVARAKRKQWGATKTKMNIGLTRIEFENCKNKLIADCALYAPWSNFAHLSRSRDADAAVDLLAFAHYNSRRFTGYSNYHYTLPKEIKIADEKNSNEWGIEEGARFKTNNDKCRSGYRGDDSPMANWPKDGESVSVNGISHLNCKDGILAHSRYTNITTLISGLSCHSPEVRKETLFQLNRLYNKKTVVIWDCYDNSWFCSKHEYKCCMDWPFETTIAGLMGHSGIHRIHGVSQIINGECVAIPFDENLLNKLFEQDISPDNYDIDLQDWRANKKSGFVLTNTDILREHQRIASAEWVNKLKTAHEKGNLKLFDNKEYRQRIRREIARKESIYVVNDELYDWAYNFTTDYFHCFDSYVCGQVKSTIIEQYACQLWSKSEIERVVKAMS